LFEHEFAPPEVDRLSEVLPAITEPAHDGEADESRHENAQHDPVGTA
jgi:hypothetical protein